MDCRWPGASHAEKMNDWFANERIYRVREFRKLAQGHLKPGQGKIGGHRDSRVSGA